MERTQNLVVVNVDVIFEVYHGLVHGFLIFAPDLCDSGVDRLACVVVCSLVCIFNVVFVKDPPTAAFCHCGIDVPVEVLHELRVCPSFSMFALVIISDFFVVTS